MASQAASCSGSHFYEPSAMLGYGRLLVMWLPMAIHAPVWNHSSTQLYITQKTDWSTKQDHGKTASLICCKCPTWSEEVFVQSSPGKATTEIHPACACMVGKPERG